jgi:hypothetical protein
VLKRPSQARPGRFAQSGVGGALTSEAAVGRQCHVAIVLAGLSAPSSSSNRRRDLLAWSMTLEVDTRRQFTALRSDI